jgi:hypothetical protein
MLARPKALWHELKHLPAGHRFEMHYEREHRGNQKMSPVKMLVHWSAVIVCFAIGVVLVFIPGPAVVFFALAAALAAAHSRWVARGLDASELKIRQLVHAARGRWKRLSSRRR